MKGPGGMISFVVKGGAMTATGLYLREDGAAGTIRHVDLDV